MFALKTNVCYNIVGGIMKIDKIKKTGSKYKITLENGEVINTYDDVILENNLLFDKNIDSKLLNKINTDTLYYESYNKVLKMIGQRLRSEKEIIDYLDKTEVIKEDQNKIIGTLKRIGLINDYNFAKAFTNDKINLTLEGPYKIMKELKNYKIEPEIIDEVIENYSQEIIDDHIEKIILKKLKTNKKYSGYVLRQRIVSYLINQGYSMDSINNHLYLIKSEPNIKEMEKIYNKCALKYQDAELYYKVKNKLMAKGYQNNEIEEFLEQKKE